jgi:hypothetical protein
LLACIAIWFGLIDLGKHIDCSILSALKKMVDEERDSSASWFLKDLIATSKTQFSICEKNKVMMIIFTIIIIEKLERESSLLRLV